MLLSNETSAIVLDYINNINAALGITSTNRDNVGFNSHYYTAGFVNHVPGFSAHSSPQVYQMRRFPELLEASHNFKRNEYARLCFIFPHTHFLSVWNSSGILVQLRSVRYLTIPFQML